MSQKFVKRFFPFGIIFALSLITAAFSQNKSTHEEINEVLTKIEEHYQLEIQNVQIKKDGTEFILKKIQLENGVELDELEIRDISELKLMRRTDPPGP